MKAEELRIGSLYMSVKFGVPVKWELTDFTQLDKLSDGAYNDPPIDRMIQPIVLTEEWLLKLGFEVVEGSDPDNFWSTKHKETGMEIGQEIRNELYFFNGYDIATYIQYVHELQNLYFDLTGNELTLKN